jgi:hypothetical protein
LKNDEKLHQNANIQCQLWLMEFINKVGALDTELSAFIKIKGLFILSFASIFD